MLPRRQTSNTPERAILLNQPPPFQVWRNSVSAAYAPQVETSTEKEVPHSDEKEVVIPTGKEVALEDGKEAAPAYYPPATSDENLPQAIDPEGNKEVAPEIISPPAGPDGESQWLKNRKRIRWIIAAIATLVVMVAIALGVGIALGLHQKYDGQTTPSGMTFYDASVLPSPTTAASAPTGTYALSMSDTQNEQAGCLPSQNAAWDCSIASGYQPAIIVQNGDQGLRAQFFHAQEDQRSYYGTWAQNTSNSLAKTYTVLDTNATQNGPAIYFQQYYDKIVIVPEDDLSSTSSNKIKRRSSRSKRSTGTVAPGTKAWYCVFKATLVEGFIYLDQTASYPSTITSTSTASETTPSTLSPSTASTATPTTTQSTFHRYPLMVKLEERRVSGSSSAQPYCQQYEVLDDGSFQWSQNSYKSPITIQLDEQDDDGLCTCEWISGEA